MAALMIAALLVAISPAEQQERYEIGLHIWQQEARQYHATIRDYERRIKVDPADNELRDELDSYKREAGASINGIWMAVQRMKRKMEPSTREAV